MIGEITWDELLKSKDQFDSGSRIVVWDALTDKEHFCELVWVTDGKSNVERPVIVINFETLDTD